MARVQLFLSSVSAEFLSYRERLRHLLTRPDVEVKVREDFIVTGDETLGMLDASSLQADSACLAAAPGEWSSGADVPLEPTAIAGRLTDTAMRLLCENTDGVPLSWRVVSAPLVGGEMYN